MPSVGLRDVVKLGEAINRSQGRGEKTSVNSRRKDRKLKLEKLKLICIRKRETHSSGGRNAKRCSIERNHKYSTRVYTVTQQENKARWSCLYKGRYFRTDMVVHFGITGEIWLEEMS